MSLNVKTRSSAITEKQRISCACLSRLASWSCSQNTAASHIYDSTIYRVAHKNDTALTEISISSYILYSIEYSMPFDCLLVRWPLRVRYHQSVRCRYAGQDVFQISRIRSLRGCHIAIPRLSRSA